MKHLRLDIVIFLVAIAMITACQASTRTVAERCVLVDLQQQRGQELLPLLEGLANRASLEPDLSHPIAPSYVRGDKAHPRAEVTYRIGMGEFGAVLSLFRFEPPEDADLLEAFDRFVEEEVAPRYRVKRCSEVPGFQPPVAYR